MYASLSLTAKTLLATLLAGISAYILYQCFFSALAVFPGPLAAKLTKGWRAYVTYRGRWHRDLIALHKRYGSVVRIGPNELSVGDPEAFLQIYRVNKPYVKSACYSVVKGSRPFDLTGERSEKIHSAQRRLVARAYSMESTMRLEPQIHELVTILLKRFDDVAFSEQIIDLGYWLQLFAFDVIGAVSFSKPYGFVSSGSDSLGSDKNFLPRLAESSHSIAWTMHAEWLFKLHQAFIMPVIGNFLAVNNRNGFFFDFAQKEVQTRKDQGGSDKDIVGQLFQVQKTKDELNDLAIAYMMSSNVFAGSDTTSIGLRATLFHLIRHPKALDKLREELRGRQNAGKISTIVTAAEAESLPYLQAVIYESLRLFSPAAFLLDRDVPPEGMTICGHHVPGGTVVGTSTWVIHRAVQIWGDDAEEFRPERWLNCEDPGTLKRFFFAFGGGTRTCIGRNISWLEIETLVPTLVMRYDFKLAEDATITEDCGALVFLEGLRVQITRLIE
ncbi:cytochrome P450 [Nemania abortiva]|nr:cytochrome P450 [Nemania abortiva]